MTDHGVPRPQHLPPAQLAAAQSLTLACSHTWSGDQ